MHNQQLSLINISKDKNSTKNLSDEDLKLIKIELRKIIKKEKSNYLLDKIIYDGDLVRNVYLSENEKLIEIFDELLPHRPRPELFVRNIPDLIKERNNEAVNVIMSFLQKGMNIMHLEKNTIAMQRLLRKSNLEKEKIFLTKNMKEKSYSKYINRKNLEDSHIKSEICARNIVYKPMKISDKLLNSAKNINLFDSIRHLTAINSLYNILDEGLYGRKSLLRTYKKFREAALWYIDCENGDADVICFGAFDIDSNCMKNDTVEIILDFNKLQQMHFKSNNPTMFFKQQDLGLIKRKIREVKIGDITIYFSHTHKISPDNYLAELVFCDEKSEIIHKSYLPCLDMISSNVEYIHQILIMNFFKFLDKIENVDFVNNIYDNLDSLSEEDLSETLNELGKAFSDTMEFNFYGSYLINISLIKEIKTYRKPNKLDYSINIQNLVESLKKDEDFLLKSIEKSLPELLASYRFIDYLLTHNFSDHVVTQLKEYREKIKNIPLWFQYAHSQLTSTNIRRSSPKK